MKNYQTNALASKLKKASAKAPLWARLAKELNRPSRNARSVNVGKLADFAQDGMTLVVPGKVLAIGNLEKSVKVAAFGFSEQAQKKIEASKGECMSIEQLLEKNPKATKIKIIG